MLKSTAALILVSLLYVTTVQCLSPQNQAVKDELDEECKELTEVTEESIQRGRSGQYPPDQSYKCFITCQRKFTAAHFGDMDMEEIVESLTPLPEEVVDEREARCGSLVGTDDCDTGYIKYKCFSEIKL